MKTGNTTRSIVDAGGTSAASMEPGHEDREYQSSPGRQPGADACLNGARS